MTDLEKEKPRVNNHSKEKDTATEWKIYVKTIRNPNMKIINTLGESTPS